MDDRLRTALLGDWHPVIRDPIDLLRATLLLGGLVEAVSGDLGGAVRMLLTMGLVLVPRLLNLPRPFDLAFLLAMSLQAWGNVFELFETVAWYDRFIHLVNIAFIAPTAYIASARLGILPDPTEPVGAHSVAAKAVITFLLGIGLDAIYEMYEYLADAWLGTNLSKGEADVIGDLIAATFGAALGGAGMAAWSAFGWTSTRRVPPRRVSPRSPGDRSGS